MLELSGVELIGVALVLLAACAALAFWLTMLVDCLRSERFSRQDRLLWVVVIVLLKAIGAVLYYFMHYRPSRSPGTA